MDAAPVLNLNTRKRGERNRDTPHREAASAQVTELRDNIAGLGSFTESSKWLKLRKLGELQLKR